MQKKGEVFMQKWEKYLESLFMFISSFMHIYVVWFMHFIAYLYCLLLCIVFHQKIDSGKTYKGNRGAKLQVFLCRKKITGRSSLRFSEKCAGRNLISARSLYLFDDAIDQVIKTAS